MPTPGRVLGQVVATRHQYTVELCPIRSHRMSRGDQVERRIGERERHAFPRDMHLDPTRSEQLPRPGGVRRPRLRDTHPGRQPGGFGEHLAASGVDVHCGSHRRQPPGQQARVTPRRPFLGRPPVEPAEVPSRHVSRRALGHQRVEGPHTRDCDSTMLPQVHGRPPVLSPQRLVLRDRCDHGGTPSQARRRSPRQRRCPPDARTVTEHCTTVPAGVTPST